MRGMVNSALFRRWSFSVVDDHDLDRFGIWLEFQAQLILKSIHQRGSVRFRDGFREKGLPRLMQVLFF